MGCGQRAQHGLAALDPGSEATEKPWDEYLDIEATQAALTRLSGPQRAALTLGVPGRPAGGRGRCTSASASKGPDSVTRSPRGRGASGPGGGPVGQPGGAVRAHLGLPRAGALAPVVAPIAGVSDDRNKVQQRRNTVSTVSVRYIVHDVDTAISFYCDQLGFQQVMHPAPSFAMLSSGDLRLVLSAPGAGPGGGQAMPDGTLPEPGGWNRFQLEVADLETTVDTLRHQGTRFRNEIVTGVGGKQILVEDPSGNPIELFEPTRPEARLSSSSQ